MTDFTPIGWDVDKYLSEHDESELSALLVGHRVTKVADDHLLLDDGTVLKFEGNTGCGGCSSGWYELTELNNVDNIITAVEIEALPDNDYSRDDGVYRIFVFADNKRLNLATFEGTDGNGYYGTGFSILVRPPRQGE